MKVLKIMIQVVVPWRWSVSEINFQETVNNLRSMDWARAADFYRDSPDGQWDNEAHIACTLMPQVIELLEGVLRKGGKL